jgi:hypothetical protein
VLHELDVAFSIQNLALSFELLFFFLVECPLSLEHFSFSSKEILFVFSIHFSGLLLPFKNGKGIRRDFLFFDLLLNFALKFLLSIKLVQLSIYLLFHHLLLDIATLVNQLLFTLDLRT